MSGGGPRTSGRYPAVLPVTADGPIELVVIGASLGGVEALAELLAELPRELPAVAIVLHRSAESGGELVALVSERCSLRVIEPDDKTPLEPGTVYVAPADYHLQVEPGSLSLSCDQPVRFARPSIDVLLQTAADAYGGRVVAVLLTCASTDGVEGARAIRAVGGEVLVQDPATARSPVLPRAVIDAGLATAIAPLPELATRLVRLCLGAGPKGAAG